MSALFPESPHFTITLEPPDGIYYDVLVSAHVLEADATLRDNTAEITLLKRFLPAEAITQIPDRVQRVSVRVMARAERFTGASELVEVGTSLRDITPEMDPEPVTRELVQEALAESVKRLYRRLTDGAL
jgi:hypothetical protein